MLGFVLAGPAAVLLLLQGVLLLAAALLRAATPVTVLCGVAVSLAVSYVAVVLAAMLCAALEKKMHPSALEIPFCFFRCSCCRWALCRWRRSFIRESAGNRSNIAGLPPSTRWSVRRIYIPDRQAALLAGL